MYFRKKWLRKIWLDKCLKSRVSEDPYKDNTEMVQNTVAISMAAPLQYLLITVKVVALEKVSFSDTQNPKTVC